MIALPSIARGLRARLLPVQRMHDQVVGDPDAPYMLRWRLWPRNALLNAYLHRVLRPDEEAALHDHPWPSVSLVLSGAVDEFYAVRRGERVRRLHAGDLVVRRPRFAHRLCPASAEETWTLFITGPRLREWGFHCANGWRDWKTFTAARADGQRNGCD